MSADPKYSAGARFERKAVCARLRRRIAKYGASTPIGKALNDELTWMISRRSRYDRAVGGLGKKGVRR